MAILAIDTPVLDRVSWVRPQASGPLLKEVQLGSQLCTEKSLHPCARSVQTENLQWVLYDGGRATPHTLQG